MPSLNKDGLETSFDDKYSDAKYEVPCIKKIKTESSSHPSCAGLSTLVNSFITSNIQLQNLMIQNLLQQQHFLNQVNSNKFI